MDKRSVRNSLAKQRLRSALKEFFAQHVGPGGEMEVKIVDDLILLRCKKALSLSEINVGALKAGRLLLQEVSERLCQELRPSLDSLVHRITGLRLVDGCVGLFIKRREKIYVFTMSGHLEH